MDSILESHLQPRNKFLGFLENRVLPLGFFAFLTGLLWLPSRGDYNRSVYLLLLIPGLILLLSKGKRLIQDAKAMHPAGWFALLFLVWYAISASWSDGDTSVAAMFKYVLYIGVLLFTSAFYARRHSEALVNIMDSASVFAAAIATYGIANYYFFGDTSFAFRVNRLADVGIGDYADFRNPILAGIYYGMFSVWLFARVCSSARSWKTPIFLLSLLLLQAYVFLTYSRTAWVGCIVAYAFCILAFRNKRSLFLLALSVSYFTILLGFVSGGLEVSAKNYYDNSLPMSSFVKKAYAEEGSDSSVIEIDVDEIKAITESTAFSGLTYRDEIWLGTLKQAFERLYFGHGADASFFVLFDNSRQRATHAHNVYIQFFYDSGLIGLVLYLASILTLLYVIYRNRTFKYVLVPSSLLLYMLVVTSADVENLILGPRQYWLMSWFPIGFILGAVRKNKVADYKVSREISYIQKSKEIGKEKA